jgi:hypothetical protein
MAGIGGSDGLRFDGWYRMSKRDLSPEAQIQTRYATQLPDTWLLPQRTTGIWRTVD